MPPTPKKNKSLRLLLWKHCNRSCQGCCNNQFDIDNLPVCTDYTPYDEILLTGGEPMLLPGIVLKVIENIRSVNKKAKIYVYTAKVDDIYAVKEILMAADGITVTAHEPSDMDTIDRLSAFLSNAVNFSSRIDYMSMLTFKTRRLNIFKGVRITQFPTFWTIKSNMKWLEDCPLPENETLMQ